MLLRFITILAIHNICKVEASHDINLSNVSLPSATNTLTNPLQKKLLVAHNQRHQDKLNKEIKHNINSNVIGQVFNQQTLNNNGRILNPNLDIDQADDSWQNLIDADTAFAHQQQSDLRTRRVKRSNIPCGASFPCSQRPTGVTVPFINGQGGGFSGGRRSIVNFGQDFNSADDPAPFSSTTPSVRPEMVLLAAKQAHDDIDRLFNETEPILGRSQLPLTSNAEKLWAIHRRSHPYAKEMSYSAMISLQTSLKLLQLGLPPSDVSFGLPKISLTGTAVEQTCPPNPIKDCVPGKYREFGGHCNNVNSPLWGASNEPLQRFLAPDYGDKIGSPRTSSATGRSLPNARLVSTNVFTNEKRQHKKCTFMLMQWSQFVFNDLVELGSVTGTNQQPLRCCDSASNVHPECYPINVPGSDPAGDDIHRCFSYARTTPAPRENCLLGPREQSNMATGFLDGSTIYGSTRDAAQHLRSFMDGRLKVQTASFGQDLLLGSFFNNAQCRSVASQPCFESGSGKVNMLPTLTAVHTIWLRQHNRIADELKKLNPHWDDERLYHESRKLVEAQIQHITYKEFLPVLLGMENMQKYGLSLQKDGYYSDYALNINPSALNAYASAVGLFFYSLMPDTFTVVSEDRRHSEERPLHEYLAEPSIVYFRDRVDGLLRFLVTQPIEDFDSHISRELTTNFFKLASDPGYDLAALILQLGRDHGIPGYTTWRHQCGLSKVDTWRDLRNHIRKPQLITKLQSVYTSIHDVDLFVLGMAEKPLKGALLGPTFACIMSIQFQKTKRGDRLWFENFFYPSAFRGEQLNEVRKTSLARVICDNTDNLDQIQPWVMNSEDDFENCPVSCNSSVIPLLNLKPWIDSEPKLHLPITRDTLQKAIRLGTQTAREIEIKEGRRVRLRATQSVEPGDSIFAHAQLLSPKQESLDKARTAKILLETTKILIRGNSLKPEERLPKELDIGELQRLLPRIDVSQVLGNLSENNENCVPQPYPCDHTTAYRMHSGWCNNLRFPAYGNAFNPFRRLLDPAYNDGFDEPRVLARNGQPLPSPRAVTNIVHYSIPRDDHPKYTHMLMQFGQFLDHDMTHSPINEGPEGSTLNCSRCDSHVTESMNCFPIPIPSDDAFFRAANPFDRSLKCLPFTRSLLGQLTLGYREQIDQLSSFIDASNIYGSTECQSNKLRLFSMGKLNYTENIDGLKEGLPQSFEEKDCRSLPQHMCFIAGDSRANEQTGLAAMHTIWLREHNRIATRLHRINNFWTDEKFYQQTRRIVGAVLQHITYNEFLPKILGMETLAKYDLILEKEGYYKRYDEHCDATASNAFATAGFRFGHTLIRDSFERMDDFFHNFSNPIRLRDMFNNMSPLYDAVNGGLDTLMIGLAGVTSRRFDRHITTEVRNHLFEKHGRPRSGMDLPAINIQRGRDHGLRPYNDYKEYCGMKRARTFTDLLDVMNADTVNALKKVYLHVDDIDLFPGIISERSLRGALVGATAACILGEQFQRARRCDRFWYENDRSNTRFNPDQLTEIRKMTLARVVCSNSQFIRKIQPNIFDMPDNLLNNQVPCQDLPDINLYEWLDRQFCIVDHRVINLGKAKRITPCVSCTCTTEGPECHSVKVRDCYKLLEEFLLQEVLGDTVCVIQCSGVIKRRTNPANNHLFRFS